MSKNQKVEAPEHPPLPRKVEDGGAVALLRRERQGRRPCPVLRTMGFNLETLMQ